MSFSAVAEFYDSINGSAYAPYADFLIKAFEHAEIKVNEVLDLGCGYGYIGISLLQYLQILILFFIKNSNYFLDKL